MASNCHDPVSNLQLWMYMPAGNHRRAVCSLTLPPEDFSVNLNVLVDTQWQEDSLTPAWKPLHYSFNQSCHPVIPVISQLLIFPSVHKPVHLKKKKKKDSFIWFPHIVTILEWTVKYVIVSGLAYFICKVICFNINPQSHF